MARKKPAKAQPEKARPPTAADKTVDMFSGMTHEEEISLLASQNLADAASSVKVRDRDLYEAVETEVKEAVRWLSEISTDRRRAIVIAKNPTGEVVVSVLCSSRPDKPPACTRSFILSATEANQLREFLNAS